MVNPANAMLDTSFKITNAANVNQGINLMDYSVQECKQLSPVQVQT
jgi:hypothetical protein